MLRSQEFHSTRWTLAKNRRGPPSSIGVTGPRAPWAIPRFGNFAGTESHAPVCAWANRWWNSRFQKEPRVPVCAWANPWGQSAPKGLDPCPRAPVGDPKTWFHFGTAFSPPPCARGRSSSVRWPPAPRINFYRGSVPPGHVGSTFRPWVDTLAVLTVPREKRLLDGLWRTTDARRLRLPHADRPGRCPRPWNGSARRIAPTRWAHDKARCQGRWPQTYGLQR